MSAGTYPAGQVTLGFSLRRPLIALGASLLAHLLIAGSWTGGAGAPHAAAISPPLQARLDAAPALLLVTESVPLAAPDAMPVKPSPVLPASRPRSRPAAVPATRQTGAVTSGPDMRFYLARELDRYPSPLSALRLGSGEREGNAGRVRLWVSIDQAGRVVDAAVIDADPSGTIEQSGRELVLATRFLPGQRDGRPVKSRVLLVLRHGT
ncbi:MAG: TonB domain protein [Proteobacteria bacterium]|nr:TonB domain protein [Pseudomonadota bacterium]